MGQTTIKIKDIKVKPISITLMVITLYGLIIGTLPFWANKDVIWSLVGISFILGGYVYKLLEELLRKNQ